MAIRLSIIVLFVTVTVGFSSLIKKGEDPSKFKEYINSLQNFCFENNIILLRTIGVIFSDMEKRETQYIK